VIGCLQNDDVRRLLTAGATGWLFDANRPASLMAALNRGLAAAADAPHRAAPALASGRDGDGDPDRTASLAAQAAAAAA
jgi:hypothetical protein